MVRGLLIRQSFLILDVILIGLIVFTSGLVLVRLLNEPKITSAASLEGETTAAAPAGALVDDLRERVAYNGIVQNGLFGPAGRFRTEVEPEPVEEPEVSEEPLEETTLNLRLWGTTSLSPRSPFATASIEDASQRERKLYTIGDDVVEDVTLEEVHQRWVILLNKRGDIARRERLSMDEDEEGNPLAPTRASGSTSRPTVLPSEEVQLNKQAFVRELYVNYADLVTKVKPELYRDASGKVAGITASEIEDIPLAEQLGLKNGDVLQTVNNEQIDSEQKVLEMVQKYQRSNSFRVGIMRNGKQKIITYNLQ